MDTEVKIETVIDRQNRTFVDPTTGRTWPFDYKLTAEQAKELEALTDPLVAKCQELGVPVLVFIQTGRTKGSDSLGRRMIQFGPRTGPAFSTLAKVSEQLSNPLIASLLGAFSSGAEEDAPAAAKDK